MLCIAPTRQNSYVSYSQIGHRAWLFFTPEISPGPVAVHAAVGRGFGRRVVVRDCGCVSNPKKRMRRDQYPSTQVPEVVPERNN